MMLYNDVSKSNARKNIKFETTAATAITRMRCRDGAGGSSTLPDCLEHKRQEARWSLI